MRIYATLARACAGWVADLFRLYPRIIQPQPIEQARVAARQRRT